MKTQSQTFLNYVQKYLDPSNKKGNKMKNKKTHMYEVTLQVSFEKPQAKYKKSLIQYENLVQYLFENGNNDFVYGSDKLTIKKLKGK